MQRLMALQSAIRLMPNLRKLKSRGKLVSDNQDRKNGQ